MSNKPYTSREIKHFASMRVAILCPMMHVEHDFVQSLADMIAYSWNYSLRIEKLAKTSRTVVDWARDDLVSSGLKEKSPFTGEPFTHFLWLDADHVFKPDLACQLARHEVDAVSALYFHRRGAPTPVVFVHNEKDPTGLKHFTLLQIPPHLVEVDAFGFGSCLTHRCIFEAMPYPWFNIDADAGEDINFCARARTLGIKFYLDGAYAVGHVGEPKIIGRETYNAWWNENKDRTEEFRIPIDLRLKTKET